MNGRIFVPGMRLKEMGLCPSTFEARRAIKQGGAKLDGDVEEDERAGLARPDAKRLVSFRKKRAAHLVP